jgi:hypothetical protein
MAAIRSCSPAISATVASILPPWRIHEDITFAEVVIRQLSRK